MYEAGVPLIAGTDTGTAHLAPGFALHQELELLVESGVPPMRALQSATRDAARMLGLAETLGTVERGRTADLVVLDADPTEDIRRTRGIHALLSAGG